MMKTLLFKCITIILAVLLAFSVCACFHVEYLTISDYSILPEIVEKHFEGFPETMLPYVENPSQLFKQNSIVLFRDEVFGFSRHYHLNLTNGDFLGKSCGVSTGGFLEEIEITYIPSDTLSRIPCEDNTVSGFVAQMANSSPCLEDVPWLQQISKEFYPNGGDPRAQWEKLYWEAVSILQNEGFHDYDPENHPYHTLVLTETLHTTDEGTYYCRFWVGYFPEESNYGYSYHLRYAPNKYAPYI